MIFIILQVVGGATKHFAQTRSTGGGLFNFNDMNKYRTANDLYRDIHNQIDNGKLDLEDAYDLIITFKSVLNFINEGVEGNSDGQFLKVALSENDKGDTLILRGYLAAILDLDEVVSNSRVSKRMDGENDFKSGKKSLEFWDDLRERVNGKS